MSEAACRLPDGYTMTHTAAGDWQLMRDLGHDIWRTVDEFRGVMGGAGCWQPVVRSDPRKLIAVAEADLRNRRRRGERV